MADFVEQERAAFEAFAQSEGWRSALFGRDKDGHYVDRTLAAMWCGWLAHAKRTRTAGVPAPEHQTPSAQPQPTDGGKEVDRA